MTIRNVEFKLKFNWNTFDTASNYLLNKIVDKDRQYGSIVAISRGGVFLGARMAILMGIKNFYVVAYNSYAGSHKRELKQVYPIHQDLNRKTVLLIDDIADSGETLLRAKQDLEAKGCKVDTMTIHYKDTSKIEPDYYFVKTNHWIIYPWEDN